MHFIVECRSYKEQRVTIATDILRILNDREDSFLCSRSLTIITHKEHLVSTPVTNTSLIQLIVGSNNLVCPSLCIFPLSCTCINFGIKIKTCQKQPCSSLIYATISSVSRCLSMSISKIWFYILSKFLNQPVKHLGTSVANRLRKSL